MSQKEERVGEPIRPGEIVSQQWLIKRAGLDERFLNRLEQSGLERLKGSAKRILYASDDVISILRRGEEPPPFCPKYKQPK